MWHNQTVNFYSHFGQFYSPKFSASSTMSLNPLWPFFHCRDKQNNSHHKTYCKGCIQHYVTDAKLQVPNDPELDAAGIVVKEKNYFDAGGCINFLLFACC